MVTCMRRQPTLQLSSKDLAAHLASLNPRRLSGGNCHGNHCNIPGKTLQPAEILFHLILHAPTFAKISAKSDAQIVEILYNSKYNEEFIPST